MFRFRNGEDTRSEDDLKLAFVVVRSANITWRARREQEFSNELFAEQKTTLPPLLSTPSFSFRLFFLPPLFTSAFITPCSIFDIQSSH
jgi:hypothetical protein